MAKTLCPFVYWAQSNRDLTLRVDLKDVKDPDITIEEEEIEFSCVGVGSQGQQKYEFLLEFYLPVDKESAECTVFDREILIKIKKKEEDWWPRLLYEQKKLSWLRIDFDKWKTHDTDDSENDEATKLLQDGLSATDALRQKYPDVYRKLQKEELGFISESRRKIYLFCYNLFMFCGFLMMFAIINIHYAKLGEEIIPKTYNFVGKNVLLNTI